MSGGVRKEREARRSSSRNSSRIIFRIKVRMMMKLKRPLPSQERVRAIWISPAPRARICFLMPDARMDLAKRRNEPVERARQRESLSGNPAMLLGRRKGEIEARKDEMRAGVVPRISLTSMKKRMRKAEKQKMGYIAAER